MQMRDRNVVDMTALTDRFITQRPLAQLTTRQVGSAHV